MGTHSDLHPIVDERNKIAIRDHTHMDGHVIKRLRVFGAFSEIVLKNVMILGESCDILSILWTQSDLHA